MSGGNAPFPWKGKMQEFKTQFRPERRLYGERFAATDNITAFQVVDRLQSCVTHDVINKVISFLGSRPVTWEFESEAKLRNFRNRQNR
jgi:hypothetical protein